MLIRKLCDCPDITAGDNSRLRELLHPARDYQFSGRYSLAYAIVGPGQQTAKHRLKSSEAYYIIAGNGEIHVGDEVHLVQPDDAVEIPPGAVQWIRNVSLIDLVLLSIVDPAWRREDEEIIE